MARGRLILVLVRLRKNLLLRQIQSTPHRKPRPPPTTMLPPQLPTIILPPQLPPTSSLLRLPPTSRPLHLPPTSRLLHLPPTSHPLPPTTTILPLPLRRRPLLRPHLLPVLARALPAIGRHPVRPRLPVQPLLHIRPTRLRLPRQLPPQLLLWYLTPAALLTRSEPSLIMGILRSSKPYSKPSSVLVVSLRRPRPSWSLNRQP